VERGLEVTHFAAPAARPAGARGPDASRPDASDADARALRESGVPGGGLLARTEHFEMEALGIPAEGCERTTDGRFEVYVCVAGSAILFAPRSAGATRLATGDLVLVPAVLGTHRFARDPLSAVAARIVRLSAPRTRHA
jgi:hypothetical protein